GRIEVWAGIHSAPGAVPAQVRLRRGEDQREHGGVVEQPGEGNDVRYRVDGRDEVRQRRRQRRGRLPGHARIATAGDVAHELRRQVDATEELPQAPGAEPPQLGGDGSAARGGAGGATRQECGATAN